MRNLDPGRLILYRTRTSALIGLVMATLASVRIRHAGRVIFDYSKGENRLE